jgi:hypothetical protein
MCLGLQGEDLFTLLLRRGYLHCLTEVATIKIANELHLMPYELMHWHEGGLLGSMKPENQLVASIGEPSNCLKVILDAFVEVCLRTVCIGGALLGNDICPFSQTYIVKTLTHQAKQCRTIVLLSIRRERECKEVLSSKSCLVRRGVSCDFLSSFLKRNLDRTRLFEALFDQIVWCAIGTQRRAASAPVKLGCVLCLDEI